MPSDADQRQLARRLIVALAAPIGLLLVLGAVLGRQVRAMTDDLRWVDHSDRVIARANETLRSVVDQESAFRGFLLSSDRTFLQPYEETDVAALFDELHQLIVDNPVQQARFEEARRRYDVWHSLVAPVAEADRPAQQEDRAMRSLRERKMRMDAFRKAMGDAMTVEVELHRARVSAAQVSLERTQILFVSLMAAAAIALALVSRRQLSAVATTFGEALRAETAARREVQDEAWVRAGLVQLGAALRGERSVSQIGEGVLQVLMPYLGADVGAFFSKQGHAWQRAAAHGLDGRAAGPETFPEGEGLIGRAAREGAPLYIEDVPANFLQVRSGTGEAAPQEVAIIPGRFDHTTNVVLELGFLHPCDARSRELLSRLGEMLAIAVRSAESKDELRTLLEESQRQSEELQRQQAALESQQAELEASNEELSQTNSIMEIQTQELERQRDELTRARELAERASRYKSEFLANMSHELRTPLNSSLILARLLADNREGTLNPEQVRSAETIYSAGNDLLALINDILDLAKIEAGHADVNVEPVSIARVLDSLEQGFRPVASERGLEFRVERDESCPERIVTDARRLEQVLKNLLSNAFKFTERGEVVLTVAASDARIRFAVRDTGIGIPAHEQRLIFEAFHQVDGTSSRKFGGTGLGLSISRELTQLLGGTLELTSTVGAGSTFVLSLPRELTSVAPREQALPQVPPSSKAPLKSVQQARAAARRAPQLPDDRDARTRPGRLILVVEDDLPFSRLLYDLAHELDFDCALATSADEGVTLARELQPSGILLDVGLPDASGFTVLERLKRDPATRHIPIHMVSAVDNMQTALQMGAIGYALKPVARDDLATAIQKLQEQHARAVHRVLLVEDDERQQESIRKLLSAEGVELIVAGTMAEALAHLEQFSVDCMVLDLVLPDGSGYDLLERMAEGARYSFPPVIVYTGRELDRADEEKLRRYSRSIIVKGARSPERLLDEVTLFLHRVEATLPAEQKRMLADVRSREALFEGRRILIVEDDVRNVFALTKILEPRGAKIEIARNGREALERVAGKDLVLMDLMMPEMDGLTAMREIRKQPAYKQLPIIALTAKAMLDDREQALQAGASDYIAKPFEVEKLLSLCRVWLKR